jgi:hypothetical protein
MLASCATEHQSAAGHLHLTAAATATVNADNLVLTHHCRHAFMLLLPLTLPTTVAAMQLFSTVAFYQSVNAHANFQTFWGSMLLLLRFSTGVCVCLGSITRYTTSATTVIASTAYDLAQLLAHC